MHWTCTPTDCQSLSAKEVNFLQTVTEHLQELKQKRKKQNKKTQSTSSENSTSTGKACWQACSVSNHVEQSRHLRCYKSTESCACLTIDTNGKCAACVVRYIFRKTAPGSKSLSPGTGWTSNFRWEIQILTFFLFFCSFSSCCCWFFVWSYLSLEQHTVVSGSGTATELRPQLYYVWSSDGLLLTAVLQPVATSMSTLV